MDTGVQSFTRVPWGTAASRGYGHKTGQCGCNGGFGQPHGAVKVGWPFRGVLNLGPGWHLCGSLAMGCPWVGMGEAVPLTEGHPWGHRNEEPHRQSRQLGGHVGSWLQQPLGPALEESQACQVTLSLACLREVPALLVSCQSQSPGPRPQESVQRPPVPA